MKTKNLCKEVTTTKEASKVEIDTYSYYSKLLQKPFDSLEELKQAEDKYNKAHALELKAKEERKQEAESVKSAITARVSAELEAKKTKADAYKEYCKICDEAENKVRKAKEQEKIKLSEFCKKHPEGFHDTIKIGDITYNYNYSENNYIDPLIRLLNWF